MWAVIILAGLLGGTAAHNGLCGNTCNLEEKNWIIILGTGRSGSTTILEMVNEISGVELSGEHNGELTSFLELRSKMRESRQHTDAAWMQEASQLKDKELYCMMQRWFFLHTGKKCGSGSIHGFKEIRYKTKEELDFVLAAFPKAKIVLNYREDVAKQAQSDWYKQSDWALSQIKEQTSTFIAWAKANPGHAYLMPLEHFGKANFNDLFRWLGYPHCTARAVTHANSGLSGGYSHAPGDAGASSAVTCLAA